MTFEEDFRSLLLSGPVAALVGGRAAWGEVADGQIHPCISIWSVTDIPDYTMEGPSGLAPRLLQVDCWGLTFASAIAVERAVVATLDAYMGTVGGTVFQGIFFTGREETREPVVGNPAARYYRVRRALTAWYCDAA